MSTPTVREQFLVISALGANPMELTNVLCRASHENRCAVVTSRLTRHGECSALILEISGSWDALARLEAMLEDILRYSRVGRITEDPETISIGELLAQVASPVAMDGK